MQEVNKRIKMTSLECCSYQSYWIMIPCGPWCLSLQHISWRGRCYSKINSMTSTRIISFNVVQYSIQWLECCKSKANFIRIHAYYYTEMWKNVCQWMCWTNLFCLNRLSYCLFSLVIYLLVSFGFVGHFIGFLLRVLIRHSIWRHRQAL